MWKVTFKNSYYISLCLGKAPLRQIRNRFSEEETIETASDLTKLTDGEYKAILMSLRTGTFTRKPQKVDSLFLVDLFYEND